MLASYRKAAFGSGFRVTERGRDLSHDFAFIASFRSRRLYVTVVEGNILYNVLIIVFHKLSRGCQSSSLAPSSTLKLCCETHCSGK